MKEYVGYLIAALLLLWHLLSAELMLRMDWVNHGTEYQQLQQRIVQAVQDLDKSLQAIRQEVTTLRQDVDRMKEGITGPEKMK